MQVWSGYVGVTMLSMHVDNDDNVENVHNAHLICSAFSVQNLMENKKSLKFKSLNSRKNRI